MDRLERHIQRYLDTLYSRRSSEIEWLEWSIQLDEGFISARLKFWDDSLLEFDESVSLETGFALHRKTYSFHYQSASGQLILRYDNAPHHTEIQTHPHHKHIEDRIEPAEAPDLSDILREIDQILSARG
jgi:hypothetical protein